MEHTRSTIILLWGALMLTYLLGDVLRVYSGDVQPGELFGKKACQAQYLGIAIFMFIPILMMVLNGLFSGSIPRWINIITTVILFVINLIGVPSYKSWYDIFLIICSLGINILILFKAYGGERL